VPAPDGIDARGEEGDQPGGEAQAGRLRLRPGAPGLVEDDEGRHQDQRAFQHGREILGLVVAIGMVGIGRHGGVADGDEGAAAAATLTTLSSASANRATLPSARPPPA
jgi:hypothetical protein